MRTTRKLLALLLAVAMVFTMTAMTALATGGDDDLTTPNGGTPTTPDGGDLTTPNGGTPTTPDGGDLTTPDGGTPTTPDGGTPTTPDGGTPTTPDGGAPTTPDGGAPTTPDTPTPPGVSEQAQTVINLIADLPTSDTILADMEAGTFDVEAYKAQVSAAQAAYDKLTEEQKAKVTNIANLTQAEANLALLESINPLGDENVCAIGTTGYPTLQAAVEEVQSGGTIKMLTNAEVAKSISIGSNKNITLDLNGKTISADIQKIFELTTQGSKLTITDNSSATPGAIESSADYMFFVTAGTLEIQKGTIRSTGYWESGGKLYGNTIVALTGSTNPDAEKNSVFKLGQDAILESAEKTEGGVPIGNGYAVEIRQNNSAACGVKVEIYGQIDHAILYTNGNIKNETNAPQITLGNTAVIDGGVYAAGYADWIVDGAKITGSTAFEIRAGSLTVNSGTITGTGTPVSTQPNGNGSTTDGVGIAIAQHTTKLPIKVTINGGEISGYTALYESNPQENSAEDIAEVTIQIEGGTFTATGPNADSVYSENKTNFITGGTFNTTLATDYLTDDVGQDNDGNVIKDEDGELRYVAEVNGKKYTSLEDALKDANSGNTVTLLKSITVNKWNQAWNLQGITLDGGGKTIKVNAIASLQNHDAVFHSAGGNTFKNLTVDLSGITQPSQAQGNRAFAAAAGDTFQNVKIIGNDKVSYGITISGTDTSNDTVTIEDCTIENCHYAIYDSETGAVENLIIKKSIITGCDYATILHSPKGQFINNQVTGGKLNIMEKDQTITGNTFDGKSRIKFYNAPKEFKQNKILEDSRLNYDIGLDDTVDVSKNYWGGGKPTKDQLGNIDSVTGTDVYYVNDTMRPQDLNTYTPPSGGGSGSSGSYLPVILSPSWSQTVSVVEHGTLTMSVRANGASSYQWYVDRGDGRFVAIAGATGDSLTIWPDMGDNGNRYYCQAMNGHGGVNSPYFTLCVVRSALPPKTGDQVCVTLWVCLMALGVAGALTAWNRQKNR